MVRSLADRTFQLRYGHHRHLVDDQGGHREGDEGRERGGGRRPQGLPGTQRRQPGHLPSTICKK